MVDGSLPSFDLYHCRQCHDHHYHQQQHQHQQQQHHHRHLCITTGHGRGWLLVVRRTIQHVFCDFQLIVSPALEHSGEELKGQWSQWWWWWLVIMVMLIFGNADNPNTNGADDLSWIYGDLSWIYGDLSWIYGVCLEYMVFVLNIWWFVWHLRLQKARYDFNISLILKT